MDRIFDGFWKQKKGWSVPGGPPPVTAVLGPTGETQRGQNHNLSRLHDPKGSADIYSSPYPPPLPAGALQDPYNEHSPQSTTKTHRKVLELYNPKTLRARRDAVPPISRIVMCFCVFLPIYLPLQGP